jgi:drug/metabolite transporter (DMT)-like permease
MDNWILYGLIAAFFIATRDMFTKTFTKKYSITEHLIYYYTMTGVFIFVYAFVKKYYFKENIRMIQTDDIWKYIAIGAISAIIISPCQLLSLKECSNPGKSKAIVNLNTIFVFFMSLLLVRSEKFTFKIFIGILFSIAGIYLIT